MLHADLIGTHKSHWHYKDRNQYKSKSKTQKVVNINWLEFMFKNIYNYNMAILPIICVFQFDEYSTISLNLNESLKINKPDNCPQGRVGDNCIAHRYLYL